MINYTPIVKNAEEVVFVVTIQKDTCVEYVILQKLNVNMGFEKKTVQNVEIDANMGNLCHLFVKDVKGEHVHVIISIIAKNITPNYIIPC
jgi:hypothetical protein